MSTTVEKLQEALRTFEEHAATDPDFLRLQDFYLEMARKGLLVKKNYDLPLVDTIGLATFRSDLK